MAKISSAWAIEAFLKLAAVLPRCCLTERDPRKNRAEILKIKIKELLARPKRFELLTPKFVVLRSRVTWEAIARVMARKSAMTPSLS